MSYYQFKTEDAERFVQQYGPARKRGSEFVFDLCPFCHGGNKPDKQTFYLNSDTGQWQCKRSACSREGNMITLAQELDFSLGDDVSRYYDFNNYNGKFRRFNDAHRVTESNDKAVEYLKGRGISETICRKYEITTKDDKTLVFPFKTVDGELKFIKYRNIDPENKGSKEWCEKNCMPILFGMNHCTNGGQLVITEGQIDSLSVAECGIQNVVSVPLGMNAFSWVPHCWDWLQQFNEIVVFGDCEKGHVTLSNDIKVRFPKITKVVKVDDYCGYKDANDILRLKGKDAILHAINNAEFVGSSRLKDMSEVESANIETQPCIKTGVTELDKILTGGFHFGGVVILSGKRGDGKSTMGSQFIVECLAQGHNCMIYSGELPNVFVKNWIDRQISGKAVLNNNDIDKCNAWYKGRLLVYDDTDLTEEDNDTTALIEIMEEAILQKNCQVLLIDNLMTAMEEEAETNEALYRKQSSFVGKMAKMARRLNVVIILVAHPRKTPYSNLSNDDVSGSADITNKASIVMSYSRIYDKDGNEPDPAERILSITKNRLTGKLGKVHMFYSDDSKRIVGPDKNFYRLYITDEEGFADVGDMDEIPF